MIKIITEVREQRIGFIVHHSWVINPNSLPYARCTVDFYAENYQNGDVALKSLAIIFDKSDLDIWGEDDTVLDEIVLNKLNFAKYPVNE